MQINSSNQVSRIYQTDNTIATDSTNYNPTTQSKNTTDTAYFGRTDQLIRFEPITFFHSLFHS